MGDSNQTKEQSRRVAIACNSCREKKVRCDGSAMPGNRCSACIAWDKDCVYARLSRGRGSSKEYVAILQTRLNAVEKLLRERCPNIDIAKELSKLGKQEPKGQLTMMANSTEIKSDAPELSQTDEDAETSDYEYAMVDFLNPREDTDGPPGKAAFLGKSSGVGLFRTAIGLIYEGSGSENVKNMERMYFKKLGETRPQYFHLSPCLDMDIKPDYKYPEPELLSCLVDTYFEHSNVYLPVLHRPSFEQGISDGLHLREEGFGAVLLVVCALAAMHLTDSSPNSERVHQNSASFWFHQVHDHRRSIVRPAKLSEVQLLVLSSKYLLGFAPPESAWLLTGVGIRLCQDAGAHRRKTYGSKPDRESELWKRSLWSLFVMERHLSCGLGRPCMIREEDFDLDLPIDCDDEYWSHPDPTKAFRQPPGKPSALSYFIAYLKQIHVLGCVLKTLYSTNKAKVVMNILGAEKTKNMVIEMDSALNKWIDEVPAHLKWDPNREDSIFARQSGHLYAHYYHIQILVHRPFITSARKVSASASSSEFPSLVICTNAARQCSKLIEVMHTRYDAITGSLALPIFTSGVVLLLNKWCPNLTGCAVDHTENMEDLDKLIMVLKVFERRWHSAARIRVMLNQLSGADNFDQFLFHINKFPKPGAHATQPRDPQTPSKTAAPTKSEPDEQAPHQHNHPADQQPQHPVTSRQRTEFVQKASASSESDGLTPPVVTPFSQTPHSPTHRSPVHPLDVTKCEEMTFGNGFSNTTNTLQPEHVPSFADASVHSMSIGQPIDTIMDPSNFEIGNWLEMYAAENLMSAVPTLFQQDEWSSYIQELTKGSETYGAQNLF